MCKCRYGCMRLARRKVDVAEEIEVKTLGGIREAQLGLTSFFPSSDGPRQTSYGLSARTDRQCEGACGLRVEQCVAGKQPFAPKKWKSWQSADVGRSLRRPSCKAGPRFEIGRERHERWCRWRNASFMLLHLSFYWPCTNTRLLHHAGTHVQATCLTTWCVPNCCVLAALNTQKSV